MRLQFGPRKEGNRTLTVRLVVRIEVEIAGERQLSWMFVCLLAAWGGGVLGSRQNQEASMSRCVYCLGTLIWKVCDTFKDGLYCYQLASEEGTLGR